uniref:Uroporphyrinogen III synthase n=1 Tax=Hucho hucho TaxID=62062 RepID=A0A4W5LPE6_9TELE
MHVLLLKEPREGGSGPDPYVKELASHGHKAILIPVLSFTFVSLKTLSDKVNTVCMHQPEKIHTITLISFHASTTVFEERALKPLYAVGSQTLYLQLNLGLVPLGEDTGTADVLSRLILEREDANILPLLFPCGSIKREVLPTALRENGIPLDPLMVYQTAQHPDLEKNLKNHFTEQGVPDSIAFFSPSGVKFCLETVRRLSGERLKQIKFAAIGPTTADAMTAEGLSVSCSADKPTAEHLATGIAKALQ